MRTTALLILLIPSLSASLAAQELPIVANVEFRAFAEQVTLLAKGLKALGERLSREEISELERLASAKGDSEAAIEKIQRLLDRHCLVGVYINPESRVTVEPGPAFAELVQHRWHTFLVKVRNDAGITAQLSVTSPNSSLGRPVSEGQDRFPGLFLDIKLFDTYPSTSRLAGIEVEYRILRLYSRDSGKREAKLTFDVGHGTQDLGFRSEIDILFTAKDTGKSAAP